MTKHTKNSAPEKHNGHALSAAPLPLDTIIHGDSRDVLRELPSQSVDVIFADPPYNLQLQKTLHRPDHSQVSAVDDSWDQFESFEAYDEFTRDWLNESRRVLKNSGTLWVIGTYHNIYRVGSIIQDLGFWIINNMIWIKINPMPNFRGVRFTNAHETLLWAKKSRNQKRYTFNYHAMKTMNDDKQMRSDWEIPICTGSERLTINGKKLHSTQKPEALLYRVIMASSSPNDVILDPFFGTGTTGAVAKKLGRRYIGIERDAVYVEAAQSRLEAIPYPDQPTDVYAHYHPKRTTRRIPFGHLLEQGLLIPGQKLFFTRKREPVATVGADGTLHLGDGRHGSIHQLGAKLLNRQTCNGWDLWFYENAEGELLTIDTLREQLRRRLVNAEE